MNRITFAVTTAGAAVGSIFGFIFPAAIIGSRVSANGRVSPDLTEQLTACLIGGALLAIPLFILGAVITLIFRLFSKRSQA